MVYIHCAVNILKIAVCILLLSLPVYYWVTHETFKWKVFDIVITAIKTWTAMEGASEAL